MKSFIEHEELIDMVQTLSEQIRYIPGFKEKVKRMMNQENKPFFTNRSGIREMKGIIFSELEKQLNG